MKICLCLALMSLGFHAALASDQSLNAYAGTFVITFFIGAGMFLACYFIGSFLSWSSPLKHSRLRGPNPRKQNQEKTNKEPRNHEN